MMWYLCASVAILVSWSLTGVIADLPVACYHDSVPGTWEFTLGTFKGANCGWLSPDRPGGHNHITPGGTTARATQEVSMSHNFEPFARMRMVMTDKNVQTEGIYNLRGVQAPGETGQVPLDSLKSLSAADAEKWFLQDSLLGQYSQIYNQGFAVTLQANDHAPYHRFYAPNKYVLEPGADAFGNNMKKNQKISHCSWTILGQWSVIKAYSMGVPAVVADPGYSMCYYGQRVGDIPDNFVARHRTPFGGAPVPSPESPETAAILAEETKFKTELKEKRRQLDKLMQSHREHVEQLRTAAAARLVEMDAKEATRATAAQQKIKKGHNVAELEAEEALRKATYARERRRIELEVQAQGVILQQSMDAAGSLHVETAHMHVASDKRAASEVAKADRFREAKQVAASEMVRHTSQAVHEAKSGEAQSTAGGASGVFWRQYNRLYAWMAHELGFDSADKLMPSTAAVPATTAAAGAHLHDASAAGAATQQASAWVPSSIGSLMMGGSFLIPMLFFSTGWLLVFFGVLQWWNAKRNAAEQGEEENGSAAQDSGRRMTNPASAADMDDQAVCDTEANSQNVGSNMLSSQSDKMRSPSPRRVAAMESPSPVGENSQLLPGAKSLRTESGGGSLFGKLNSPSGRNGGILSPSGGNYGTGSPPPVLQRMKHDSVGLLMRGVQMKTTSGGWLADAAGRGKACIGLGLLMLIGCYLWNFCSLRSFVGSFTSAPPGTPTGSKSAPGTELASSAHATSGGIERSEQMALLDSKITELEAKLAEVKGTTPDVEHHLVEEEMRKLQSNPVFTERAKSELEDLVRQEAMSRKTIGEVHDHLTEQHELLKKANHKVRYKLMDKDELRTFLKARSKAVGIELEEHSEVEKMIQAHERSLKNAVDAVPGLYGFSTPQNVGPTDHEGPSSEMNMLSERLQVDVSQITPDDVSEMWGPRAGESLRHFADGREFFLEDDYGARTRVEPDDWRDPEKGFDYRKIVVVKDGVEYKKMTIPAMEQGSCGNCYAAAASNMYTTRLIYKYLDLHTGWRGNSGEIEEIISLDQQTSCNWMNQGCEGGYPWLSHYWGSEHDLVTKDCWASLSAYSGPEKCAMIRRREDTTPECKTNAHFRVDGFRYIGGGLGRCQQYNQCERLMREEIFKGGPITTAMEPRNDDYSAFQYYKSGILHEVPEMETRHGELMKLYPTKGKKVCTETICYPFRKVDHALLAVGWGVDTSETACYYRGGQNDGRHVCDKQLTESACQAFDRMCQWGGYPYWIFQNSWGDSYGEHGFLKLGPRGSNPWYVETMPTAASLWRRPDNDPNAVEKNVLASDANAEGLTKAHGENAIVHKDYDNR
ncbi:unnamed protein product [Amoebophrya sp. A25]|nr:unnamed protein product [Amoebophrya sp. A25]|eukprot:GSA25T00019620001.1